MPGLYERTGVREYWLVNPDRSSVVVYRRTADGSFPRAAELAAEGRDVLESPQVPGWSLALARLFR
jgi:Uma2 family endonuclease